MTLTLELAPETEAQIAAGAKASGRSVADYAAELLAQAAEDAADIANAERVMAESKPEDRIPWERVKGEAFLALYRDLAPTIAAGTLRPLKADEISRAIEEAREEQDDEMFAGFGLPVTDDRAGEHEQRAAA